MTIPCLAITRVLVTGEPAVLPWTDVPVGAAISNSPTRRMERPVFGVHPKHLMLPNRGFFDVSARQEYGTFTDIKYPYDACWSTLLIIDPRRISVCDAVDTDVI